MQTRTTTLAYRMLLAAAVIAISWLAVTRIALPVVKDVNDKIQHAFAFFVLALLLDFSRPEKEFGAATALTLLGYGFAIEVTQYFLPYRTCSVFDLGADAAGLLLYRLAVPLLRNILPFKGRWSKAEA